MNVDEIITQLKTYAPMFAGNVAGAAEWELAQDQVWLKQPAAYVIPMEDEASENLDMVGLQQVVTETLSIVVDLDNSADRRGQTAATGAINVVRAAVWAAVLAWRPPSDNATQGFSYAGGGYVRSNRARLIWRFDFHLKTTITEHDGWQVPSVPLVDIRGTATDAGTGQPLSIFDAALPQS